MSSYLQEQKRIIEERKRQVLGKAPFQFDNGNSSSSVSGTKERPAQTLLVNDGNFLARFKAMQEEAKSKKDSEIKEKNSGKLTINLGGGKKKTTQQATSTLPRPAAFDTQEESEGKLGLYLAGEGNWGCIFMELA